MEEDYAWVGPSKCDEHRLAREKDLENIQSDLVSARGIQKRILYSHLLLICLGKPYPVIRITGNFVAHYGQRCDEEFTLRVQ